MQAPAWKEPRYLSLFERPNCHRFLQMEKAKQSKILQSLEAWLRIEDAIKAAVLFGSQVREIDQPAAADAWSDVDLHLITNHTNRIKRTNWGKIFPELHFCMQVVRPATGGVSKVTLLFDEGEADLVLVPTLRLRVGRLAMKVGLQKNYEPMRQALNNLSTIMGGGYRFLKGAAEWEPFYASVTSKMPGFRLNDEEIENMAAVFLCDLLWTLQKIERGELIAAQRILHRSLAETNILLLHETRIRQNNTTYQQARRVEKLSSSVELRAVQISARLNREELRSAAWKTCAGLEYLMGELRPPWAIPLTMKKLLEPYSASAT